MQFWVKSLRIADQTLQQQWLEAASEHALRTSLKENGHTVLSLKARGTGLLGFLQSRDRPKPKLHFPMFCREVRTLLRAGMTIVEAVDTLTARNRVTGAPDDLAAMIANHLAKGLSLSSALREIENSPPVLIAAVRSGERTSNLVEALDDYLRYDTLVQQLRRKLVSAAIYPSLVTGLGLSISIFLLLVVMPNFSRMYENLRGPASGKGSTVIAFSQFVSQNRGLVFAVMSLLVVAVVLWVWSGNAKRWLISTAQRSLWLRAHLDDFELAMMYQSIALLIKGGYPMSEALMVVCQSAMTERLRIAVTHTREVVERGGSISQAFSDALLCDEVGRRLMAAAERNGDFFLAAEVVAQIHGERFELFIERVTRIIEPILLIVVAAIVGSIVVAMYMPVFEITSRLR